MNRRRTSGGSVSVPRALSPGLGVLIISLYHAIANRWVKPVIESHEARGRSEGRAEDLTEGRAEGLTEGNARWRDWLNRKNEAEAQGLPFDEPPPDERR